MKEQSGGGATELEAHWADRFGPRKYRANPIAYDSLGRSFLCATDADRSLVEYPLLVPYFDPHPVTDATLLLASEVSSNVLYGRLYCDLIPLLDGKRSRHEIVNSLSDRYSSVSVQTALVSLASKGYVVSGEFSMPPPVAGYWCALGVTPRWAEERLANTSVALKGDCPSLLAAFAKLGVSVRSCNPTLAVIVTDDFLDGQHAETNRRFLESGTAWSLISPKGFRPLFGPVFRPGEHQEEDRPCWSCLSFRLRSNHEVENFLRQPGQHTSSIRVRPGVEPLRDAVLCYAAVEIAKWLVLKEFAPLDFHAISINGLHGGLEYHRAMKRPQCHTCGDPELYRPERPPSPVLLSSSPKPIRNSGGLRSVTPEETIERYRHLVSPVSGVVTELRSVTEQRDDWIHVYFSGSNLALRSENLFLLRNSLRTKSSGKGSTAKQAEASALCEALERYSGVYHGDEIRRKARFRDFSDEEAIHPNVIQLYSDTQYRNAETINARGSRFNYIPDKFDPDVVMDWSPVWSVTQGRHRYLPTQMLYYSAPPADDGNLYCGPDSNGCAAGNTMAEAVVQGFLE